MTFGPFFSALPRDLTRAVTRALAGTLTVSLIAALGACGGGSDDDSGSGLVRVINASSDYATIDFYADDALLSKGVASFSVGDYGSLGSGSHTFLVKRGDSTVTTLSTDRSVAQDEHSTVVFYNTANTVRSVQLTETEAAPAAGNAKLRIFNSSYEAGAVDLYLTPAGGTLDDLSPVAANIGAEGFSGFAEVAQANYRLVVTATGDKTDVRLDLPSVALADQQVATLLLTTTPGGVLEHGLLLNQGGPAVAEKNPSARLRLVADTTASGSVSATINGTVVANGLKSPTVAAYQLVPAGPMSASIQVNGQAVAAEGLTVPAGADLTLLVLGTPTAPSVSLLTDDNRRSYTSTNARLRLVHGVNNLNGSVTLTADYSTVATDVAFGLSSAPGEEAAGTTYRLEASSASSTAELFLATDVSLQAGRVYTVFVLGDAGTPLGILRRDR